MRRSAFADDINVQPRSAKIGIPDRVSKAYAHFPASLGQLRGDVRSSDEKGFLCIMRPKSSEVMENSKSIDVLYFDGEPLFSLWASDFDESVWTELIGDRLWFPFENLGSQASFSRHRLKGMLKR
jgi:hypothetical protein